MREAPGPQGTVGRAGPRSGGVVYTRWGKSSCPSTAGTQQVYVGRAGGGVFIHMVVVVQTISVCQKILNTGPTIIQVSRDTATLYGIEYEEPLSSTTRSSDDAVCVVCFISTRDNPDDPSQNQLSTQLDKRISWVDYLMFEYKGSGRTTYVCVDQSFDQAHTSAGHFYHVEATCNSMPCPPYVNYKELTCVVCTR